MDSAPEAHQFNTGSPQKTADKLPTRSRRAGVSVTKERLRGEIRWVVSWREGGRRRREYHATRGAAQERAGQILSRDREILEAIHARGLTLERVWADWLEKIAATPKRIAGISGPTLSSCIADLIQAKRAGRRAERYVGELQLALHRFSQGREEAPIASITAADIEAFLEAKGAGSRSTYRARLATLFRWAVRRGILPADPMVRVESVRTQRPIPSVLTVRQAARTLVWCRSRIPRALGAYVLSLLCGLRPEEAQQTTWSAVRLDSPEPHVVVEAQTSKVRQRRVVYPLPAAVAWLRVAKRVGAELPLNRQAWRRTLRSIRVRMGWKRWPQDVTRHTAASYWLAKVQNAHLVAEQLGHSPAVLKTHYQALVTRADAERFWGLIPKGS